MAKKVDLDEAVLAVVEAGGSVTFDVYPVLTNMLRCTVTTNGGESAFAVCPDQMPDPVTAALLGALAHG